LSDFHRDCLDGSVYDRVAARTRYSRDQVKPMFLAVVYGKPNHMRTEVGKAIRALYPSVFNAVEGFCLQHGVGVLPRFLQRLESGVMIRRVAARLLRERPTMPLLTVHDSVLVPAEFTGEARRVIEEEWQGEFGVVPGVKTSMFTEPQRQRPRKKRRRRRRRSGSTLQLAF
jgi:hypothetical protein